MASEEQAWLGSAILAVLGLADLVLSLLDLGSPSFLTPTDNEVRPAMARSRLRLAPQTSVWPVWQGFNLSHSLGLMGLGVVGVALGFIRGALGLGAATYVQPEWKPLMSLVGIGGTILFLSSLLYFFLNIVLTLVASRGPAPAVPEFAEALSGPGPAPAVLDRWRPWIVLAFVLIAVAYGPTLVRLAATTPLTTPGLRVW